jgi:membrane-bound serine protease (ClpP class)
MRTIRTLLLALPPALAATPAAAIPGPAWTGALGLAGWTPGLMVLAGLLLLVVELFVIPGFGWSGLLGLLALLGGIILVVSPEPADAAFNLALLVSSLTLMGIAVWHVASRMRAGHPLLGGILSREEGYVASVPRVELEGTDGVALTDLRPAGTALFGDERLDVVSDEGWIPAGSPVRVLRSEGYRHIVRAVPLPRTPAGDPSAAEA